MAVFLRSVSVCWVWSGCNYDAIKSTRCGVYSGRYYKSMKKKEEAEWGQIGSEGECPIIVLVTIGLSCLRATFMWIRWENRKVKIPLFRPAIPCVKGEGMPPCTLRTRLHRLRPGNDRKFLTALWKIQSHEIRISPNLRSLSRFTSPFVSRPPSVNALMIPRIIRITLR